MLIEFTVGNYRSFRDPVTLSLVAARLTSKDHTLDENSVFAVSGNPALLTAAAVYGPNAGGKSNLVHAIAFMRKFVLESAEGTQPVGGIDVDAFRLNRESEKKTSRFEIVFIIDQTRYRYGFEVDRERVMAEWLYTVPTRAEALLFERVTDSIKIGANFKEGRGLSERTRPNALFLSVAAQWNGPIAQKIVKWFRRIGLVSGLSDVSMRLYTEEQLLNGGNAEEIIGLVKRLDLGIAGITVERREEMRDAAVPTNLSEEVRQPLRTLMSHPDARNIVVKTVHKVYDSEGNETGDVEFDLDDSESAGTAKLFSLAGPLIDTLKTGRLMIVDELDSRLHPMITRELIKLFNIRETNSAHAQLIFTTQDSSLLDNALIRRDQVWFVEKDSKGASQLYSLAEFKGVRNDLSLARNYVQGRFGAVPYLDDLPAFIKESRVRYGAQAK